MWRVCVSAWFLVGLVWAQDEAFLSRMREYNEAWVLAGRLNADEAIPRLQSLIQADWTFRRAYLTLAEIAAHTGRSPEAEKYFRDLIAKNPKNGYAWYGLAQLRSLQSRPYLDELVRCIQSTPEALICYVPEVLPRTDPAYPGYWYAKGIRLNMEREKAPERFTKAIELVKARHEDDYLPMLVLSLSGALQATSDRPEEVLRLSRSAVELAARRLDKEVVSKAQVGVASALHGLAQNHEARQIMESLLREAQDLGHRRLSSDRAASLAALCMETADHECARRAWKIDLEFQESIDNRARQVHALFGLAKAELQDGNPKAAIASCERALGFDHWGQKPFLLRTLAAAYLMQGDSFTALRLLTESRALFRSREMHWQAGADTGSLGNLYVLLGNDELAESCYRASAASARKFRDAGEEQRVLMALARLLIRQNRLQEAAAVTARALERATRARYTPYQPMMYLVLAEVKMKEGRREECRRMLEQSLSAARQLSRFSEETQALIRIGDWQAAAGRGAAALDFYGQAVRVARDHELAWPRVDAYQAAGRMEMKQGRAETALEQFRAALDVVESLRERVPENDLHLGFSRKMWPLYEEAVDAHAAIGSDIAALEVSERGRARAFLESLPAARGGERARVLDQAQLGAFTKEWAGTVAVYVLSEPQSTAWLLDRDQVRMVRIGGRRAIERLVRQYRAHLSRLPDGQEADYKRISRELYKALVRPLEPGLRADRTLAIVPEGILYYLPFEALLADSGRFLVEDHPIVYAPSVSVLASLSRNREGDPRRRELLAYGDPQFAAGQSFKGKVEGLYRSAGFRFVRLPASRDEVLRIGKYFPPEARTLRLGREATEESVKRTELSAYRRLHFATHAVLDERIPARSGVVLSQVGKGREDGILHANEVAQLKLDADLVVLSACQTGLGQLVGGEGMVGLTRSFFHAGARRVAMSLWDVNDVSTARLMKEFYGSLVSGRSAAEALRRAKLSFLHSPAPLARHPHFWAGFVLSGAE